MNTGRRVAKVLVRQCAVVLAGLLLIASAALVVGQPGAPDGAGQAGDTSRPASPCEPSALGSPYIPVDSWIYPAMLRLYSLGFVDDLFLGMRPWTRASVSRMLKEAGDRIDDADQEGKDPATAEAREIYGAVSRELHSDVEGPSGAQESTSRFTRWRGPSAERLCAIVFIWDTRSSTTTGDPTKTASITTPAPAATPRPAGSRFMCAANSKERLRPPAIPPRWPMRSPRSTAQPFSTPLPACRTARPPSPWDRSAWLPMGGSWRLTSPRKCLTTYFHSASRMNGWGPDKAAALRIQATRRTSTHSKSIALNRCRCLCFPGSPARFATNFWWAHCAVTRLCPTRRTPVRRPISRMSSIPAIPGCMWRR